MDLDAVASELYGLPLDEFTAVRNDRTKQARAEGEPELARQVQSLRKPTMAAWLANQLTRQYADEVNVLLDLGREMRAGMAGVTGDELRLLTRRRHELVSALVRQTMSLAGSRRVSSDVESDVRTTLEATLSDPQSAEALAAGRLVAALDVSGFGLGGLEGGTLVAASPSLSMSSGADVVDLDDRRNRRTKAVEKAEAAVAVAEKNARRAHARREKADAKVRSADEDRRSAVATVERLHADLERASAELAGLTDLVGGKQERLAEAEAEAGQADRALAHAREDLRRLTR
ncbi:MAG: hypothetical protein H0U61_13270 [Nocardioidaceae bacterium]|nr:hypothetical protein [Nocardioidaceae bacterium]